MTREFLSSIQMISLRLRSFVYLGKLTSLAAVKQQSCCSPTAPAFCSVFEFVQGARKFLLSLHTNPEQKGIMQVGFG